MVSLPVSGAFVGRAGDLARLEQVYRDPAVTVVLVAGEAGAGKSRLVSEFHARLPTETTVLIGRCPELGNHGVAFGPFLAAMRMLLRAEGADGLRELLPGAEPALARWLPELAGAAPADPDRTTVFGEVLTVFERLAQRQPMVLVIEDLHWADDSSLDLVAFLIANLAYSDVLIVATHRPVGPGRLRGMLAELRRLPGVTRLALEPLTRHDVGRQLAALLGREPEPGLLGRLYERSGGNPLFVEALSQSADGAPADLTDLLLACLAGLSADATEVLRAAAVAGAPVEHRLLVAAAELAEDRLDRAVAELVDAHLLAIDGTGYEFRHVLIRQAVYQDQLPARRARIHARLAAALRAEDGLLPPERHHAELAEHAYNAGEWSVAVAASLRAAEIAGAAGARPEQLRHLVRVLELWDRVSGNNLSVDRLDLLERVAEVCALQGLTQRGVAAVDEALPLLGPDDPQRHAALLMLRARLNNQAGGGHADLRRALAVLPAQPPNLLRGQVLAELAAAAMFTGDAAGAATNAHTALEIAERLTGPAAAALAARAHTVLGLASAADFAVAAEHFTTARALSPDPDTLLSIVTWESAVLVAAGEYASAIDVIQQGLRTAHDTFRFVERGPVLVVKWVQSLTVLGQWREALTMIDDALTDQLPPLSHAALLLCYARITLAQGDVDAALVATDQARSLLSDADWAAQYRLELVAVQADLAVARDAHDEAAGLLAETLGGGDLAAHHHETWPLLARAGQYPGIAVDLHALAETLPSTTRPDEVYRLAVTAAETGDPQLWERVAEAWHDLRRALDHAEASLAAGQAHLARGDRGRASTALCTALATGQRLGAATLTQTVELTANRARLTLGSVTPPENTGEPARRPGFGLTTRELDVLRLVAKGLSNRQIGTELFISGNTAGVHVSHILTKLGATTRTQAAALAHQHNLFA